MRDSLHAPTRERHVGPAGFRALHVLAQCPRMPTNAMRILLGHRDAVTTAQLLARLKRAGLAECKAYRLGPLVGPRPIRLWALTTVGRAFVSARNMIPALADVEPGLYGQPERWRDPNRQRDLPMLIACYRLLAKVARDCECPVYLVAWEHPWIRYTSTSGSKRRVSFPASATLRAGAVDQARWIRVLLLPDIGTASLRTYRPSLARLLELRDAANPREQDETVLAVDVVPAGSSASVLRVQAWEALLAQVSRRGNSEPLPVRIFGTATLRDGDCQTRLGRRADADDMFALLARHPLLTRQQLAVLLGTSTSRIASLEHQVVDRAWLRPVAKQNLPAGEGKRVGLLELTPAGRSEAARRLLLPAGLAARTHGLLGGRGKIRAYLHHLAHTVGTNETFVAFAVAARSAADRGNDVALEEWRSATACARGRFRPDGYGRFRYHGARFGFFVEFDRATETVRHYDSKIAAYYRYRDSGLAARDFSAFPTLLVVTISERAEARFADRAFIAQQLRWANSLSVYLTTTDRVRSAGVLGPIWRVPGPLSPPEGVRRMCWLPRQQGERLTSRG